MGYAENGLSDLEKGIIYTTEELARIVQNKRNALVLCEDTSCFSEDGTSTRYLVMDRKETFIHRNEEGSYFIPSSKTINLYRKKM